MCRDTAEGKAQMRELREVCKDEDRKTFSRHFMLEDGGSGRWQRGRVQQTDELSRCVRDSRREVRAMTDEELDEIVPNSIHL